MQVLPEIKQDSPLSMEDLPKTPRPRKPSGSGPPLIQRRSSKVGLLTPDTDSLLPGKCPLIPFIFLLSFYPLLPEEK